MKSFFLSTVLVAGGLFSSWLFAGGTHASNWGGGETPHLSKVEVAIARLSDGPDAIVFQAALQAIQDAHPGRVILEPYGLSRNGRTLNFLRVLPWDRDLAAHPTDQPAVAVVPDLHAPASPESILQWAETHIGRKPEQGQLELVIYPLPDPDGWIRGTGLDAGGSPVSLERNFPIGWSPWIADHQNPGSAPLSTSEAGALAQSLQATPRFVGLLSLAAEERLQGAEPRDGSLERFVVEGLGLALEAPSGCSPIAWDKALERAENLRPKLRVRQQFARRLSANVWMLDVEMENRGQRGVNKQTASVVWQVGGAILLANARAPGDHEKPFIVLQGEAQCEIPAGGESLRLRLVLQVEEGTTPSLKFSSPKLGTTTLPVTLDS